MGFEGLSPWRAPRRIGLVAGCVGCILFVLAPEAGPYVAVRDARNRPMRWAQNTVTLRFIAPAAASTSTRSDLLRASNRAARAWAMPGVPSLKIVASAGAQVTSEDAINTIILRANGWCSEADPDRCYDPAQAAITHVHSRVLRGAQPFAEIIEADVEVNFRNPYLARCTPEELAPHLQAVLAHEMGHVLGLDHSCSATALSAVRDSDGVERPLCASSDEHATRSIMYPGLTDVNRRAVFGPSERDRAGLKTLYRSDTWARWSLPASRWLRVGGLAALGAAVALGHSCLKRFRARAVGRLS